MDTVASNLLRQFTSLVAEMSRPTNTMTTRIAVNMATAVRLVLSDLRTPTNTQLYIVVVCIEVSLSDYIYIAHKEVTYMRNTARTHSLYEPIQAFS